MKREFLIELLRDDAIEIETERIMELPEENILEAFAACPECGSEISKEELEKAIEDACCPDKFIELVSCKIHDVNDDSKVLN